MMWLGRSAMSMGYRAKGMYARQTIRCNNKLDESYIEQDSARHKCVGSQKTSESSKERAATGFVSREGGLLKNSSTLLLDRNKTKSEHKKKIFVFTQSKE